MMRYSATVSPSTGLKERTQTFRTQYADQKRKGEIRGIMRESFLRAFIPVTPPSDAGDKSPVHLFATALETAFWDDDNKLASNDRERVLIALLAGRADDLALAIHLYMGWLEGIEPEEIGEILFLGGVYNGINTMTRSLEVYRRTFDVVERLDPKEKFDKALGALKQEFTTAKPPATPCKS